MQVFLVAAGLRPPQVQVPLPPRGDRLSDLLQGSFDSRTVWPASLPPRFDAHRIMELGMDPGLGIRALHGEGVTGEGVGIASGDYGFCRRGASSSAELWIASLYALGTQVKPDITPQAFWAAASDTSVTARATYRGTTVEYGRIVDPRALVAAPR